MRVIPISVAAMSVSSNDFEATDACQQTATSKLLFFKAIGDILLALMLRSQHNGIIKVASTALDSVLQRLCRFGELESKDKELRSHSNSIAILEQWQARVLKILCMGDCIVTRRCGGVFLFFLCISTDFHIICRIARGSSIAG